MSLFQQYAKEIVSLTVPFLAWGLARFLKAKAKLVLAKPHEFTFLVQEPLRNEKGEELSPTQTVRTISYLLKNTGSEPAKGVELVFNWKPLCLNIWPSRHVQEHTEPDRRYVLILESLAPEEFVGFELLSVNVDLPELVTVRSEQCIAKRVEMYPQPTMKPWLARVLGLFMLAGMGVVLYMVLLALQFLILGTPYGP